MATLAVVTTVAAVATAAMMAAAAPACGDERAAPAAGASGSLLVALSFNDDIVDTGPDTLTVIQHARGTVQLSSAFHWSGRYAVEIHDEAGDHDFPELLGSFPLRRSGRLDVHFALLVATPEEAFNFALAGPRRFTLQRDGFSVWLQARGGYLLHVSDGTPQRLFQLRAFTWYFLDFDLDLDAGLYDLRVTEEGAPQPLVYLRDQPNAAHQPGSAVEVFSFIGDLEDVSRVTYYIDDLKIGADRVAGQLPLVAPGRRRLFAESLGDLHRLEDGRLACLPPYSLADIGVAAGEVERLRSAGRLEPLLAALSGASPAAQPAPSTPSSKAPAAPTESSPVSPPELAVRRWREGCSALERGEAAYARDLFVRAQETAPGAPLLVMAEALAEIARGRTAAAAAALGRLAVEVQDDPRRAVLEALLLARAADWGAAEAAITTSTPASPAGSALLASARYHLELWQGRFHEAQADAEARRTAATNAAHAAHVGNTADPAARTQYALWSERAGDAALLGRDLDAAERLYQEALAAGALATGIWCRLADVHFLRGDLAGERALRERVYGTLRAPTRGLAATGAATPPP